MTNTDTNPENHPQDGSNNPVDDLLKNITDPEGRQKYQSLEDALKGTAHAQAHIQNLEGENQTIREELNNMKALYEQLASKIATPAQEPQTPAQQAESPQSGNPVDVDALYQQLQERFTEQDAVAKRESAKQAALQSAVDTFGDSAAEVVKTKAAENGISTQALLDLAATSPSVFKTVLGIGSAPAPKGSSTRSTVNSATLGDTKPNPLLDSGKSIYDPNYAKALWQQVQENHSK